MQLSGLKKHCNWGPSYCSLWKLRCTSCDHNDLIQIWLQLSISGSPWPWLAVKGSPGARLRWLLKFRDIRLSEKCPSQTVTITSDEQLEHQGRHWQINVFTCKQALWCGDNCQNSSKKTQRTQKIKFFHSLINFFPVIIYSVCPVFVWADRWEETNRLDDI